LIWIKGGWGGERGPGVACGYIHRRPRLVDAYLGPLRVRCIDFEVSEDKDQGQIAAAAAGQMRCPRRGRHWHRWHCRTYRCRRSNCAVDRLRAAKASSCIGVGL
jgi:hypothetical protein